MFYIRKKQKVGKSVKNRKVHPNRTARKLEAGSPVH